MTTKTGRFRRAMIAAVATVVGYEQAGPTGTIRRVIPYPYGSGEGYVPLSAP